MKKFLIASVLIFLSACSSQESSHTVSVGTIAGPETELMQVAARVAQKQFGLTVKVIVFSDYNTPNQALNEGDLDANAFQTLPFLQSQNAARQYHLVSVGNTFLYPMAIYSSEVKNFSELKENDKVAIPNDPSNEARALLLIQKAGLIQLVKGATLEATPMDIIQNPKHLRFVELDAAELARSLKDVSLAAINTNYALPAGLHPSHALFIEDRKSPYMNIIAAKNDQAKNNKIVQLVKAYQSPEVLDKAKELFGDAAIAGW